MQLVPQLALCRLLDKSIDTPSSVLKKQHKFFKKEQDTEGEAMKEASCYRHKPKKERKHKKEKENKSRLRAMERENAKLYKVQE